MGQNNFILFGFIMPAPKDDEADDGVTTKYDIPYAKALIKTGPEYAGEVHPIFLTGQAANIAYEEFQKRPGQFRALAEGRLKTFNNIVLPVVHYLDVYEADTEPGAKPKSRSKKKRAS